jgi:hypothetical protein
MPAQSVHDDVTNNGVLWLPAQYFTGYLKAAETDKRALATFGKPFGLALYGSGKSASSQTGAAHAASEFVAGPRFGLHPDGTTSIPRPSRYYGRWQSTPLIEQLKKSRANRQPDKTPAPPLVPVDPNLTPQPIDNWRLYDPLHNATRYQVCGRSY